MKSKLNTLKFDQMGEEMFETKVIPWIASSKSSYQINRLLFPAHLLLREFRVLRHVSFISWNKAQHVFIFSSKEAVHSFVVCTIFVKLVLFHTFQKKFHAS